MIRLITNLSELHIFSGYNATYVSPDAISDIAVIIDDFHIVEKIHEVSPTCFIIFISSHYHYLNKALEYHVFSYLLKPVSDQKLEEEIHKLMIAYHKRNKKCIIHTYDKKIIISAHDLLYFSTSYKELKIVTIQDTYYTHINNKALLLEFIESLDFIQVSKSLYVNKCAIISYGYNSILLCNGEKYFLTV